MGRRRCVQKPVVFANIPKHYTKRSHKWVCALSTPFKIST